MARDGRTVQGMPYRRPPRHEYKGWHNLRCKSFLTITFGALLMIVSPIAKAPALIIVGICVIMTGLALLFMDYVARNMYKDRTASVAGDGIYRSWDRLHRNRRARRHRASSRAEPSAPRATTEETNSGDNPPTYAASISVEELMRCPEPSDWTFLPSEPPPVYFPPITSIDSDDAPEPVDDPVLTDQSERPVFTVSRQISALTFTLPSYEEATTTDIGGAESGIPPRRGEISSPSFTASADVATAEVASPGPDTYRTASTEEAVSVVELNIARSSDHAAQGPDITSEPRARDTTDRETSDTFQLPGVVAVVIPDE
ncbi:uncharacterized protein [Diadema antillarum]|uniref:uncharacterized protein n=1 Tax=Diadema antillarum TaxID=105358 RepID=UPI003A860491